jgi:hypothetical protein
MRAPDDKLSKREVVVIALALIVAAALTITASVSCLDNRNVIGRFPERRGHTGGAGVVKPILNFGVISRCHGPEPRFPGR